MLYRSLSLESAILIIAMLADEVRPVLNERNTLAVSVPIKVFNSFSFRSLILFC